MVIQTTAAAAQIADAMQDVDAAIQMTVAAIRDANVIQAADAMTMYAVQMQPAA